MARKAVIRDVLPHGSIPSSVPWGTTAVVLRRAQQGDSDARNELARRYGPILRRFVHGRLPQGAHARHDTDDVVQVALVRGLEALDRFQNRGEGALLAYLRQITLNLVRDASRWSARAGPQEQVPEHLRDPCPTPLEAAVGREVLDAYEDALPALRADQRQAVILRVEFGYSFQEIAEALGRPSATAARLLVRRSLISLANRMSERGIEP